MGWDGDDRKIIFYKINKIKMSFELIKLPYEFDQLEPYIDSQTVDIHYSRHHKTYLDKFINAINWTWFENESIEYILENESKLPENIRSIVHNNWWWYYNHNIYFESMIPGWTNISDELSDLLDKYFWWIEQFKEKFTQVSINQFGSWRACLSYSWEKLVIYWLPNQDTAIAKWDIPLLMLDVWEHAYYLKYQNKRVDYINNWWNIVNWNKVMERIKN